MEDLPRTTCSVQHGRNAAVALNKTFGRLSAMTPSASSQPQKHFIVLLILKVRRHVMFLCALVKRLRYPCKQAACSVHEDTISKAAGCRSGKLSRSLEHLENPNEPWLHEFGMSL